MSEDEAGDVPRVLDELRRVLRGVYRMDLDSGTIRVRIGPLPDHLVAASAVEDDHLWLFVDRNKPYALDQARELLETHPELIVHIAPEGLPVTRGALSPQRTEAAEFVLRLRVGY
jgi:hypothetical protein